jgi:predicted phage tail component-like protein
MNKKYSITFNNLDSYKDLGLSIKSRPNVPVAQKNIYLTDVAGRNGSLTQDLGTYKNIEIEVDFNTVIRTNFHDKLRVIRKWLQNINIDKLEFSDDSNFFYKTIYVNIDSSITRTYKVLGNFKATFVCYPYAFLKIGETPVVYNPTATTWETIIMNEYDLSFPHFKIYGKGDISVFINGVDTNFYSVDEYIECDSDLQQCYKGTQNLGMNMSGEFPVLNQGKNTIIFTGDIKQVILTPHWRIL